MVPSFVCPKTETARKMMDKPLSEDFPWNCRLSQTLIICLYHFRWVGAWYQGRTAVAAVLPVQLLPRFDEMLWKLVEVDCSFATATRLQVSEKANPKGSHRNKYSFLIMWRIEVVQDDLLIFHINLQFVNCKGGMLDIGWNLALLDTWSNYH